MNPVTVIGIGSPYGDDQLGWQVVERLKRLLTVTKIATSNPGSGSIFRHRSVPRSLLPRNAYPACWQGVTADRLLDPTEFCRESFVIDDCFVRLPIYAG